MVDAVGAILESGTLKAGMLERINKVGFVGEMGEGGIRRGGVGVHTKDDMVVHLL